MRNKFAHRPFVLFAAGLAFGLAFNFPILSLPFLGIGFALGVIGERNFLWASAGLILGAFLRPSPMTVVEYRAQYSGLATVLNVPELRDREQTFRLRIEGSETVVLAKAAPERLIALGDVYRIDGQLLPLSSNMLERADDIGLSGRFMGEIGDLQSRSALATLATRTQRSFIAFARKTLPKSSAGLLPALAVNGYGDLDPELQKNLRRTSLVHLISASGFHVVLLLGFLQFLLSRLAIPRPIVLVALAIVGAFYCLICGLSPTILRALFASLLAGSAYLFRRHFDVLNGLGLAISGLLILEPRWVYGIGIWIMVAMVVTLELFAGIDEGETLQQKVMMVARSSFWAWVGSSPIIAYAFGTVSLISVVANVLLAWIIGPILALALVAWGLNAVVPTVAEGIMQWVIAPALRVFEVGVNGLGGLPMASVEVPPFSPWWLVGFYLLLFIGFNPARRRTMA
ncbi:MAG: ComEC/Rec2 family competence protein [Armatimonadetes bacterium]|nr:ComEC/Rec2 family competence protein [Armatimonadota bacterium]